MENLILSSTLKEVRRLIQEHSNRYMFEISSDDTGNVPVMFTFSSLEKYHSLTIEKMREWRNRLEKVVHSCGINSGKWEGDFYFSTLPIQKVQNVTNEIGNKYVLKLVSPGQFISEPGRMNTSSGNKKLSDRSIRRF